MSACDVAADQLKCLRALSQILSDGALTMPNSWHFHTFTAYDPPIAPTLEGLFLDDPRNPPSVKELRELLDAYAERYGLRVEEKPHGQGGRVGLHATGTWQGVELHVWGPAVPDGGAS